ncbi:MAG: Sec-independent protein translocase protein TatB [Hyphomicrobiaceae bacterium]
MFDLTSSKLLILGLVALIVVGPKDLPLLLRTIGKYVGLIRRQANEFRAQFDEAMRDQELANLKSEMESVKRDVEGTINRTTSAVRDDIDAVTRDIDRELTPRPAWSDPIDDGPPEPPVTSASAPDMPAPASAPAIEAPAAEPLSIPARPLDAHEFAELEHRINGATAPVQAQPAPPHTADPAPKAGA